MDNIDLAAWTTRAKSFVRGLARLPGKLNLSDDIEVPGLESLHREWLESGECSLPPEVNRFVATASQWCCFSYEWKPPAELLYRLHEILPGADSLKGGANFCEGNRFANYDHRAHFQTYFASSPLLAAFVEEERSNLLMLTPPEAGDQLALHIGNESEERGGVYLSAAESGTTAKLANSFGEFLVAWERICYLTPTRRVLCNWVNSAGLLDPDEQNSRELRSLLSLTAGPEGAPA